MKIEIQSLNFSLAPAQRRYIEGRLGFTLDANSEDIERVEVWLSEIHVAEGNVHKRCLIQLELKDRKMVVSESIDPDLRVAIHRAVDQASWKVPRCLERQKKETSMGTAAPQPLAESRLRSEYMLQ